MSMLTPLGTGGRSSRGRRWPRVLAVVVTLAVAAAAGYALWQWLGRDGSSSPVATSPSVVCRTPTPKTPKALPGPSEVTVAVVNGTDRAGLAVETADSLAAVGFDVSDIGNASKPVKTGVADIHYDPNDLGEAITVASYVPGARLVEDKQQTPGIVTVGLGPDFDALSSPDDADPRAVTLPTAKPVCRTKEP